MSKFDELNSLHGAVPVSGDVSISIHPTALVGPGKILADESNPLGQKVYEHGLRCQSVLYTGLKLVEDAARATTAQHSKPAVDKNGKKIVGVMDEIPDAQKTQLAGVMGEAFEAIAHQVQSHVEAIAEYADSVAESINTRLAPVKDTPRVAASEVELRGVVARQEDPVAFLNGCCVDGDVEVVQAVLNASPRASNITKAQQEEIRALAGQLLFPREWETLQAAKQIHGSVLRSIGIFTDRFGVLLPVVKVTPAIAAQAALKSGGATS